LAIELLAQREDELRDRQFHPRVGFLVHVLRYGVADGGGSVSSDAGVGTIGVGPSETDLGATEPGLIPRGCSRRP